MGAEYELKFQADPVCQEQMYATLPADWQTLTMETTYYDTPSRALSSRKYMLRRRLENGISICTLKTAGQGNLRGEWEVRSQCVEEAVEELCKLGCPGELSVLCKEGLIPICGARFTRRAGIFRLPEGSAELALDRGILFAGEKELPLCEVEVEHKTGSPAATDAFARQLADLYGLTPEEKSKFARALALI